MKMRLTCAIGFALVSACSDSIDEDDLSDLIVESHWPADRPGDQLVRASMAILIEDPNTRHAAAEFWFVKEQWPRVQGEFQAADDPAYYGSLIAEVVLSRAAARTSAIWLSQHRTRSERDLPFEEVRRWFSRQGQLELKREIQQVHVRMAEGRMFELLERMNLYSGDGLATWLEKKGRTVREPK